ncbi:hypothetical protein IKF81_01500 [Candidatus Saccharibacteria bacterium]|nr:hypothetical protein [Candidatus Saccharibacteria bacterium]
MKKCRKGFTIIEVVLFLALSGFLIGGIILSTNISISRQRYNDSVNDFAEFLRKVYSNVYNVSNNSENAGRSGQAIYGKLIVIGEDAKKGGTVYSYSVVGKAAKSSELNGTNIISMLKNDLHANVIKENASGGVEPYEREEYTIPWEALIQQTDSSKQFKGLILVVRSPVSGTIHTYSYINPPDNLMDYKNKLETGSNASATNLFSNLLNDSNLTEKEINMCIQSEDNNWGKRRNVRIADRASNSSGVELISLDSNDNKCK